MQFEKMTLEIQAGIATLTFRHPEKLNAMTTEMWGDLPNIIDSIEKDDGIKVLVITGEGRGFCSGSDVSGRLAANLNRQAIEKTHRELMEPVGYIAYSIHRMEVPVIAAINGVAAGAGLSFALLSNIRIASEKARFSAAWVNVGLIGDLGATYLLPRIIGPSKAMELLTTGDVIDAREAERIGLVNKVVSSEKLMSTVMDLATKIAEGPALAIKFMKRAIYKGLHNDFLSQLDFESYAQNICRQSHDHKECVRAFIEKRKPKLKGI